MIIKKIVLALMLSLLVVSTTVGTVFAHNIRETRALVIQTDFGLEDGAVSAMKGVAFSVDPNLRIFDITHEIPEYNIWEASYRLLQTIPYWPSGTVFVSVIDPGVGGDVLPVVAKSKNGQFFVTPNNGTLTLINDSVGIIEIRVINQVVNRLGNSQASYTFFGRDVYALTAAKLASGKISFEQVGNSIPLEKIVSIPYQKAQIKNNVIKGIIPVLDIKYGNIWTNIPLSMLDQLKPQYGDIFSIVIKNGSKTVYEGKLPYYKTFSEVAEGKGLIYVNSLLDIALGLNMDSFASVYKVSSGPSWNIEIKRNK